MKKKNLLFFFSDESNDATAAVVPTLAHIAEAAGAEFESYICVRMESWAGKALPLVGNSHLESFYYLANFYDKILYCGLSSHGSFQFRREVLAFGGDVISCKDSAHITDFYKEIYAYFHQPFPQNAFVIPALGAGELDIAPYCYHDVKADGGVGYTSTAFEREYAELKAAGIARVTYEYCTVDAPDMQKECLDTLSSNDTYASVTKRMAERHTAEGKGVCFADPQTVLRHQTEFLREGTLSLFEDKEWRAFIPVLRQIADAVDNLYVVGNQLIYHPFYHQLEIDDDVSVEISRNGMAFSLLGPNPRIGFSVQKQYPLPVDWLKDAPTPWDNEMTDEELQEKIDKRMVPVCFLFYAADLGHLPVISRFLDLCALDGMKGGIAFPSSWYRYHPELLEQLYIPLEQGGVMPNLEPLISSAGSVLATEAEGFIEPEFLTKLLKEGKEEIAACVGERMVPRGYYPFQDSNPSYEVNSGKPQFAAVEEAGFEYYITYQDGGERGALKYRGEHMWAFNQQTFEWNAGGQDVMEQIRTWEVKCEGRNRSWQRDNKVDAADWLILSFDTPFWALSPNYLGGIETTSTMRWWNRHSNMKNLFDAMQYVKQGGGSSGLLFMVTPHELSRYIRLLDKNGLLRETGEKK